MRSVTGFTPSLPAMPELSLSDARLLSSQEEPEPFAALRARRAERYLAKQHARRRSYLKPLPTDASLSPPQQWAPSPSARPQTAPAPQAASQPSSSLYNVEVYGPAAKGIPKGGNWKCVRKRDDVLQGRMQVAAPWALHYYPQERRKSLEGGSARPPPSPSLGSIAEGGEGGMSELAEKRDRILKKLQKRVCVILAQLSDVNDKLRVMEVRCCRALRAWLGVG
jgi:hypothetical protein